MGDRSQQARTTTAELVGAARKLAPLLVRNADQGERDRRVAEESIAALTDAGLFKVAVPRRYGGHESTVRTMLDVAGALGEADGGTAWVVALCNVGAWLTGLFDERAQDDVFGADPDARICSVLASTARSRRVDGGFSITGRWHYNSGCRHATWTALGFPVTDSAGEVVDQGLALIPAEDFTVEDTWFVAGMKSTGSDSVTVDDAFVPNHRVMSLSAAIEGSYPVGDAAEGIHRSAFVPFLVLALVGPQLGMGRAALELVVGKAATRPIAHTFFERQLDSTAFQLQIAKAATKIDTAHLHAYRAADDIDQAAARGEYPDLLTRARVRADAGRAIEQVIGAIDILLYAHGAGSFADTSPLQRIWRDANVAARHAGVLPAVNYEIYGKALLGVEERISPLI